MESHLKSSASKHLFLSGTDNSLKLYNLGKTPPPVSACCILGKSHQSDGETHGQKVLFEARRGNIQGLRKALYRHYIFENALRGAAGGRPLSRNQFDLAVQRFLVYEGIILENEVCMLVFGKKPHN